MWNYVEGAEKVVIKLSKFLQVGASIVLLFMMCLIPIDVIGRGFFNQSITGVYELVEMGTAIAIFFALALTHHYKGHIAIGFVVDKLSHRARNFVEGIVELVVVIVVAVVGFQLLEHAERIMSRGTTTTDLGFQLYPFIIVVAIATLVFALKALFNGLNNFREAVQRT